MPNGVRCQPGGRFSRATSSRSRPSTTGISPASRSGPDGTVPWMLSSAISGGTVSPPARPSRFPAAEPVAERRRGHPARHARSQRHVRQHPPLERRQRPARRLRRYHAHRRSRPAGHTRPAGPARDRLTRRAHLEPASCGQVDQGGPEAELVQSPGQQADDRGRLRERPGRPAIGLLIPATVWAAPSSRSRRRRDDQQDGEQEQPRRAAHDGHRKHGIPSDPSSHRSLGRRRPPALFPRRPLSRLAQASGSVTKIDKR